MNEHEIEWLNYELQAMQNVISLYPGIKWLRIYLKRYNKDPRKFNGYTEVLKILMRKYKPKKSPDYNWGRYFFFKELLDKFHST